MSDRLRALREKRAKIANDLRAMLDVAEKENRELTTEESARYDTMFNEQESARTEIVRVERQVDLERELAATAGDEEQRRRPDGGRTTADLQMEAFRGWLRTNRVAGEGADEFRALQAGVNTEGGYLVAPEQFVTQLIQAVDNQTFIRNKATKFTLVNAASLGAPSLDTDPADADWTTELATGSEDSSMAFGKRELSPKPVAKRIKVSKKLMRMSALPIEAIVLARLAYKFGITHEKAFLTGSGANQPLGLFTANANGISTGRDVATDNTSTAITFDGLINAKYSVKSQYWPKCEWLFHRDAVKMISKLKDGENNYVWRESVRAGEPDRLFNAPVNVSEYVPNTFTSGLYVGMFGDFSHYWIVDALDMQIQRLVELYAETNQDGFIGRMESDGQPVLEEAFARVKLG